MAEFTPEDLVIKSLGERTIASPLEIHFQEAGRTHAFYGDDFRVLLDHNLATIRRTFESGAEPLCFEAAGPRRKIFFEPEETTCAIVTCGGLCPGLNDVIRSVVMQAYYRYGVPRTLGIRYGFEGLIPDYGHSLINLTPSYVTNIHRFGGTALGTSRGPQDIKRMVDQLIEWKVSILFVVGGDGTQRGGREIGEEASRRGHKLAVVGVPKTIDNDMAYMDKSFGYETACAAAVDAIAAAHTEARSARNGIGLVKLMGRHSGFIACSAAISSGDANCVLIPEVPFVLEGDHGLLEQLRQRVVQRGHAVVIVAEGAGQSLVEASGTDASGNKRLGDIGVFLKAKIEDYFRAVQDGVDSQVHRSELHDSQCSCLAAGSDLLHATWAGSRSRRHGWEDRLGGRSVA